MSESKIGLVRDAPADAEPEWLRVAEVSLAVRDLEPMETFYRDSLGLGVLGRTGGTVRLGAGSVGLLNLVHRPDALPDDPAAAGLFHTAFLLPGRAELGRWLAHISRGGHQIDGAADHLASESIYLSDPEGNGVEVSADRPRAQWIWTETAGKRHLKPANARLDATGLLREGQGAVWTRAPTGTRIGHVHLRVGNVAEARHFYGDVLGMDVMIALPGAVFLSTGGYHHHVAVNTWQSDGAGMRDPRRTGLAAITFEAAGPGLARMTARAGAALSVEHQLYDPWGNVLRFRALPVTRHQSGST